MENQNPDYTYKNVIQIEDADESRKFIANVFYMDVCGFGYIGIAALMLLPITQPYCSLLIDRSTPGNQLVLFYIACFRHWHLY